MMFIIVLNIITIKAIIIGLRFFATCSIGSEAGSSNAWLVAQLPVTATVRATLPLTLLVS